MFDMESELDEAMEGDKNIPALLNENEFCGNERAIN
jgi:hypothetical protein